MIYKQSCRDFDLCAYLFAHLEKGFTQIYRALYEDTMLLPNSEGHQHGGRKVTETSNFPSKRKVITLEIRNIEINICPRKITVLLVSQNLSNNSSFDLF